MQSELRQIVVGGVPMTVEVTGDGPPLVFLHAGIADRRMWEPQAAAFADTHRVIRYDLRGFGETPLLPGPFSLRADLRELLGQLDATPAVIVGCSFGGKTALEATIEYPEIARALILVGAPLGGYEWGAELEEDESEIEAAFSDGDFERAADVDVRVWIDGPHRTAAEVDHAFRERARAMALHVYEVAADVDAQPVPFDPPAIERLTEVHVPVLVLAGELDQPAMLEMARVMADGMPNARLVTIPGASHLPSLERPETFNAILREFLSEVSERAR
jgi:pimeloyl-ACP methyl ester carboxylesterase